MRLSPGKNWVTIGFASTLYLGPILELLLADIPAAWQAEIRLGLQEALVNAAKHGNKLDPSKKVSVRFSTTQDQYCWVVSDQGPGFNPSSCDCGFHSLNAYNNDAYSPEADRECGRGLFILERIFDRVEWNAQGTELTLVKHLKNPSRLPLIR
ncbi:MAG: anti-sigma regulatory factor [Okeania sp. SIO2H7]|nr:anti-sigma regulatory factor [Okeania sp. SIO2H7]